MTTIVLAAGLSKRMGKNKLLLPINGKTIIEETIASVLPFSKRIIVVVGHEKERIMDALAEYPLDFVENRDYSKGQKSSTIVGIRAVESDDFAIITGDLPLLTKKDIKETYSLLASFPVARAMYNGYLGHPVAYRKENRERLLAFPGTMKEYLETVSFGIYNGSLGTIYDVDTPQRYEKLLSGDCYSSFIQ